MTKGARIFLASMVAFVVVVTAVAVIGYKIEMHNVDERVKHKTDNICQVYPDLPDCK